MKVILAADQVRYKQKKIALGDFLDAFGKLECASSGDYIVHANGYA